MIHPKIKEKICAHHNLPQVLICLSCENCPLFCINCVYLHNHVKEVYSLNKFCEYFSSFVNKVKDYQMNKQQYVSVNRLIRERKQQLDRFCNELAQYTINKIKQQKRKLYYHLDSLASGLIQQQAKFIQQKEDSLHYLMLYSQDKDLLEIKIKTSSKAGIQLFKKNINFFKQKAQKIEESLNYQKTSILENFDKKYQKSFLSQLDNFIKSQPIEFGQPLPGGRNYLFQMSPSNRPNSSVEKRNSSFSSGVTRASSKKL